jgi:peptide/bleomycin uptake transporter
MSHRSVKARDLSHMAFPVFQSFFPKPKVFFLSVILWTAVAMIIWYAGGHQWGQYLGLGVPSPEDETIVGIHYFWSPSFFWLYVYYVIAVAFFAAFWFRFSPASLATVVDPRLVGHPVHHLFRRADIGRAQQLAPAVLRSGAERIRARLDGHGGAALRLIGVFAAIAFMAIFVFVAHALPRQPLDLPLAHRDERLLHGRWKQLRHIEGASQRVQEDTMRFAGIMEGLGVSMIDSVMTLIAFLPLLWSLSSTSPNCPWSAPSPRRCLSR